MLKWDEDMQSMTNQIKMGETSKNTKIGEIGQHKFCDILFSQANWFYVHQNCFERDYDSA